MSSKDIYIFKKITSNIFFCTNIFIFFLSIHISIFLYFLICSAHAHTNTFVLLDAKRRPTFGAIFKGYSKDFYLALGVTQDTAIEVSV